MQLGEASEQESVSKDLDLTRKYGSSVHTEAQSKPEVPFRRQS